MVLAVVDIAAKAFAGRYVKIVFNDTGPFGAGMNTLSGVIGILVIAAAAAAYRAAREPGLKNALVLIIAGGSTNLLERLARGGVTDFISVPGTGSFNLADIYLAAGIAYLAFQLYKKK